MCRETFETLWPESLSSRGPAPRRASQPPARAACPGARPSRLLHCVHRRSQSTPPGYCAPAQLNSTATTSWHMWHTCVGIRRQVPSRRCLSCTPWGKLEICMRKYAHKCVQGMRKYAHMRVQGMRKYTHIRKYTHMHTCVLNTRSQGRQATASLISTQQRLLNI